jgi:DNA repair exonuclease SbcCD ATPase subunit
MSDNDTSTELAILQTTVRNIAQQVSKLINGNGREPLLDRIAQLENKYDSICKATTEINEKLQSLEDNIKHYDADTGQRILNALETLNTRLAKTDNKKQNTSDILIYVIGGLVLVIIALALGPDAAQHFIP